MEIMVFLGKSWEIIAFFSVKTNMMIMEIMEIIGFF